jgi:hypothetical protein
LEVPLTNRRDVHPKNSAAGTLFPALDSLPSPQYTGAKSQMQNFKITRAGMNNQTTREFLRSAGIAMASVGASSLLPSCASAARARGRRGKKPNIIFILADDLGQQNNVAQNHLEIVAKIAQYMKAARTLSEHWKMPGQ